MPISDHAPRLNFLKDSASSLASLSPSTAAHLMAVHHHIFHEECRPLNPRIQENYCGACGSPRKPEWTKTRKVHPKPAQKTKTEGATVYTCLRCPSRTVKPGRKDALPTRVTKATTNPSASASPVDSPGVPRPDDRKMVDNASSKKRAKARKQGGLQALMASKQKSQNNSSSLDLFDFLQQ